jgi:glucokinase
VFGAGKNQDHVLFVAIGTGIGGAIVQHGKLWHGAHFSAGEIGYLIAAWDENGQPKSLENCAAGPALEHIYQQKMAAPERLTLRQIAEAAAHGDTMAQQVIQDGARLTGQVLAAALCLLDPAVLIIGGGVPQIGALWWQPFEAALQASPLAITRAIPVVQATLGTQAQIMGAALLALEPSA